MFIGWTGSGTYICAFVSHSIGLGQDIAFALAIGGCIALPSSLISISIHFHTIPRRTKSLHNFIRCDFYPVHSIAFVQFSIYREQNLEWQAVEETGN